MKIENLKLKIIFFGNTNHSVIVAKALFKHFGLLAVVTIPSKAVGRNNIMTPSPVKEFASKRNIPCITSDKLDTKIVAEIALYKPDFLVVADYGLFLPNNLLALPKYEALNVHHSLLPKYRGPSPAPTAILNGEKVSGVSIIKMSDEVDAGDIVAQKEYPLRPDETTDSLLTKLNTLGGEIIIPVINNYIAGKVKSYPQDNAKATQTKHMHKEDGFVDFSDPPSPEMLDRMIRAYSPWPGVWTRQIIHGKSSIIKFLPEGRIQVEGKKPMSYKDFANGYPKAKAIFNSKFKDAMQ